MHVHRISRSPLPAAVALAFATAAFPAPLWAAELVQGVRSKLSAADLGSGEAAVEAYRLAKGVDPEYLNAVGWLARGAEMLGKREKAAAWIAELRREIRGKPRRRSFPSARRSKSRDGSASPARAGGRRSASSRGSCPGRRTPPSGRGSARTSTS